MIRIGLVGYGYWGPNLLRNFLLTEDCTVAYICDLDEKRLQSIKKLYSNIQLTNNIADLLGDKDLQAIVIATPPGSHYSLAKRALLAGKDVLVEKPLTTTTEHANELVKIAKERKRILLVDHTFVYSKPVEKLKKIIDSGDVGKIVNINSVRINLGLYQNDVNVVQDLGVHDFSIFDYLIGSLPKKVLTIGGKNLKTSQEDQAYVHLWYPKNIFATVQVSWLSPIKVRQMILCGTKQMVVYDDIETSEKIKVFKSGIKFEKDSELITEMRVGYRKGDVFSPYTEVKETLSLVVEDFIRAIKTRKTPRSDGNAGARVVKVIQMAQDSLRSGSKIVELEG